MHFYTRTCNSDSIQWLVDVKLSWIKPHFILFWDTSTSSDSFILFSFKLTHIILIHAYTENIALGKPSAQSSLFGIGPLEGAPGKAVDGIADPNYENGHCSHTHSDNPSWWLVDLGSKGAPVSEVYIVNRFTTDPNLQQRSKDYKITLGKTQLSVALNIFICIRPAYIWWVLQ